MLFVRILIAVLSVFGAVVVVWSQQSCAKGTTKRNELTGIRIPSTMKSETAWRAAHQAAFVPMLVAAIELVVGGITTAALVGNDAALVVTAVWFIVLMITLGWAVRTAHKRALAVR